MTEPENPQGPPFKVTVVGDGVEIDRDVDVEVAMQVIGLVMGGALPGPSADPASSGRARTAPTDKATSQRKPPKRDTPKKARRRSTGPGVVKNLSLRPQGKTPFSRFATEKEPKTHGEKQAVIVFWLQHEAEMADGITAAHINTCYQEAGWPRPNDLVANLYLTASRKGYVDTSDVENISITTRGEDLVGHSLPAAKPDDA